MCLLIPGEKPKLKSYETVDENKTKKKKQAKCESAKSRRNGKALEKRWCNKQEEYL